MDNETIVPGVGVGGLNEKYDIKILICYLLHSVNTPLSREQLNFIFQNEQLVNYFSFCDALEELLRDGHLSVSKSSLGEVYALNPLGIETAERLKRSLPQSLRDNVVTAAMHLIARVKIERENKVEMEPHQNGLMVHCTMHDADFDLMRLSVFAPDDIQAERIKNRFLENPSKIYQGLISLLLDESKTDS